MIRKKLVVTVVLVFCLASLSAQDERGFGIKDVGLNLGWYSPSLDYWKNDSEFKEAGFEGAFEVRGYVEAFLFGDLTGRLGIGFWQTNVEEDLQGFGLTTWSLTGYPLSVDLLYYPKLLKFSVISPYIGAGGEFLLLQQKLRFDQKENPDPVSGSSGLFNGIVGFETRLSDQFSLDLEFNYKVGKYSQDFNVQEPNPDDPENPITKMVTEDISLSGAKIGLTLKYLF